MISTLLSSLIIFFPLMVWAYILLGNKRNSIWLIALVSIAAYAIWRMQSPYPAALNWDMWEHQTVVNQILGGKWALLPSSLSDTFRFNGYTTAFHTLIAGAQYALSVNIMGFWWFADFFLLLTGALASASLVYKITKHSLATLFAGICSAFFFESSVVYATLFFMPQTLTGILFTLFLATIIGTTSFRMRILLLVAASIILVPLHFIVGGAAALVLFAYVALDRMSISRSQAYPVLLALLPVVLIVALEYISRTFHLATLNYGEAASYTQTMVQKISTMQSWYSYIPLLLLPLGVIESFIDARYRTITLVASILAGVTFAEFPYALKFFTLGRYVAISIMAVGVTIIFSAQRIEVFNKLVLAAFIAVLGGIYTANISAWQDPLVFKGIASYVSADDVAAIEWLKNDSKVQKNMMIVSDPATQAIYEPLTGINSQGGPFMNEQSRTALTDALLSENSESFSQSITGISDTLNHETNSKIVVISARTLEWLRLPIKERASMVTNIWRPQSFTVNDDVTLEKLLSTNNVHTLYENPSVAIVTAKESL